MSSTPSKRVKTIGQKIPRILTEAQHRVVGQVQVDAALQPDGACDELPARHHDPSAASRWRRPQSRPAAPTCSRWPPSPFAPNRVMSKSRLGEGRGNDASENARHTRPPGRLLEQRRPEAIMPTNHQPARGKARGDAECSSRDIRHQSTSEQGTTGVSPSGLTTLPLRPDPALTTHANPAHRLPSGPANCNLSPLPCACLIGMMLSDTLIRAPRTPGLHLLQSRGRSGARELSSWRLRLAPGERASHRLDDEETVVVLQSGRGTFAAGAMRWPVSRRDVFDERATACYVPPGESFEATAETALEAMLISTPAPRGGTPALVSPD